MKSDESFGVGDIVVVTSCLYAGRFAVIDSINMSGTPYNVGGILQRGQFNILIDGNIFFPCLKYEIKKVVPKYKVGQSLECFYLEPKVLNVEFDFKRKEYKYILCITDTKITVYESEIPTKKEKTKLKGDMRKIQIELKDSETAVRFIDYLMDMPNGNGVTIRILKEDSVDGPKTTIETMKNNEQIKKFISDKKKEVENIFKDLAHIFDN